MSTVLHPTAGYILNVAKGADPGLLSDRERNTLLHLAETVLRLSQYPKQAEKRELWYRHNRLEKTRPMLLIFPEDSWEEVLPEDRLEVQDPFWRQIEWYLRHLIYRDTAFADDFVIGPTLYVNRIIRTGDWGLIPHYHHLEQAKTSYSYDPPLVDPADIDKLHYPSIAVDEVTTQRHYTALCSVFEGILPVQIYCSLPHANLIGEACALRGINQIMLDMCDRPEWLHQLMDILAEGMMRTIRYLEEGNYLTLNNRGQYNDSGGIGWSTELPAPDFDGQHVRLKDLWGFGVAQELSLVGPRQHETFVLDYQLRLLEQCGLNAYGCCEPYTTKFSMLKRRVPRLRRASVSPWCDIEVAARELENKIIFSWKPNPAMIVGNFDQSAIRSYIRRTLDVARECVVEIIHKDTFTVDHDPARLEIWSRIAREEIERN